MARCRVYRVCGFLFHPNFPPSTRRSMFHVFSLSSFRAWELHFTRRAREPFARSARPGGTNVGFRGAFGSSLVSFHPPFHAARVSFIPPAINDRAIESDRERSLALAARIFVSRMRMRAWCGRAACACTKARIATVAFACFPWNCTCIAPTLPLIDRTMHRSPSLSLSLSLSLSATLGFHCDPSACNEGLRTVVALI